ncbi:MAG: hypothetical protein ACI9MR_002728 [Myxococcota bacterium]
MSDTVLVASSSPCHQHGFIVAPPNSTHSPAGDTPSLFPPRTTSNRPVASTERGVYIRAVEARFAALRGRGFMISALDIGVIDQWRTLGIPVHLTLRVLEEEVRRFRRAGPARELPRSLGYFEKPLREAFRRYVERMPVPAATDTAEADDDAQQDGDALAHLLVATLERAGKQVADPAVKQVLRHAWRQLTQGLADDRDIWSLTAEVDAAIVERLSPLLPAPRRASIASDVQAAVEAEGGATMSEMARKEHAGFVSDELTRAHYDVPELMATLLSP